MKARLLAAVLAITALAGCERGLIALPQELVGTWRTDPWTATYPIPSGATPSSMLEVLALGPDGHYGRHTELRTAAGETFVTYAESGTWSLSGGVLVFTALMAAENPQPLSPRPPQPRPIAPRARRSQYVVAGGDLTLSPFCPAGAVCDGPPQVLHRVVFD